MDFNQKELELLEELIEQARRNQQVLLKQCIDLELDTQEVEEKLNTLTSLHSKVAFYD